MKIKPIVPRTFAYRDVGEAMDYYTDEAGLQIAERFSRAVHVAYKAIAEHPSIGTPRQVDGTRFVGLRSRPVKQFPYLIFYIEQSDHIDVVRVLHAQRDIPAWLGE